MKIPKFEKKMRKTIKKMSKLVGKRGLSNGMRSSLSHRLDHDRYQITPKDIYIRKVTKKKIVTVDGSGNTVYSRYGWQPSSDLPLHLSVYQARGDVNAVIHAHPPYLSALGMAVDKLHSGSLPDSLQVLGKTLEFDDSVIDATDIPVSLLNALTNGNVVLMPGDGVLVVGRSLDHAFAQMEQMEHDAKVYAIAMSTGLVE